MAYLVEDDLPQVWWQGRGLLGELLIGELLAPDLWQVQVKHIQPWKSSQIFNYECSEQRDMIEPRVCARLDRTLTQAIRGTDRQGSIDSSNRSENLQDDPTRGAYLVLLARDV